jgi:hypothetical protein
MKSIFIAPHNDDEALFGAIILQRYKPLVVVVTDSFIQYERGQTEITAHRRRDETRAACEVLGVGVKFLGMADDCIEGIDSLYSPFLAIWRLGEIGTVFIPALQGGNRHHDLIGYCKRWKRIDWIQYSTYTADQNYTPVPGFIELVPSIEEAALKQRALQCYTSQHWQSHFKEINGSTSEWISRLP